jgi:hypothetical protein
VVLVRVKLILDIIHDDHDREQRRTGLRPSEGDKSKSKKHDHCFPAESREIGIGDDWFTTAKSIEQEEEREREVCSQKSLLLYHGEYTPTKP